MNAQEFVELTREGIFVLIKVSAPSMLVALIVGLAISLLQALTQIQEATLTFVPKILALLLTLSVILPFMVSTLTDFAEHMAEHIIHIEEE